MTDIHAIRRSVEPELERVNVLIAESLNSSNPLINEVIGRYLVNRGKQLRPLMVVLTARILRAASMDRVIASAASVEMLHNASLIHDDVIDQSSTRHGAATINSMWSNHIAVLVGDYFVSTALQLVVSTGDMRAVSTIASLGRLLATGEMDQINNATLHTLSEEAYFEVITHKTASLFEACVEMGAYAAGASARRLEVMRSFARIFGQCFQIRDDIFDYFHSDKLGKPTGNDLREGKVTLPLIYALGLESDPAHESMNALVRRESLSDGDIERLYSFAVDRGGIAYAEEVMRRLRDEAAAILGRLGPDVDTVPLLALMDYIIARDK